MAPNVRGTLGRPQRCKGVPNEAIVPEIHFDEHLDAISNGILYEHDKIQAHVDVSCRTIPTTDMFADLPHAVENRISWVRSSPFRTTVNFAVPRPIPSCLIPKIAI